MFLSFFMPKADIHIHMHTHTHEYISDMSVCMSQLFHQPNVLNVFVAMDDDARKEHVQERMAAHKRRWNDVVILQRQSSMLMSELQRAARRADYDVDKGVRKLIAKADKILIIDAAHHRYTFGWEDA